MTSTLSPVAAAEKLGLSLNATIGAAFLGVIVSSILFGVSILQVYVYYARYPKDWYIHKVSVAVLFALDTVHLALTVEAMYEYLVLNFGNFAALIRIVPSFKAEVAVNNVIIVLVQALYALRVWKLGRNGHHHIFIPVFTWLVVLGGITFAVLISYFIASIPDFPALNSISWIVYSAFSTSTGIDMFLAAVMSYYLRKSRGGMNDTNSAIRMLVTYTLASGVATSVVSMAALIAYAAMPHNIVFMGIQFCVTRLYVNSYFAMLNARHWIRQKDENGHTVSLSNLRQKGSVMESGVIAMSPVATPRGHPRYSDRPWDGTQGAIPYQGTAYPFDMPAATQQESKMAYPWERVA